MNCIQRVNSYCTILLYSLSLPTDAVIISLTYDCFRFGNRHVVAIKSRFQKRLSNYIKILLQLHYNITLAIRCVKV